MVETRLRHAYSLEGHSRAKSTQPPRSIDSGTQAVSQACIGVHGQARRECTQTLGRHSDQLRETLEDETPAPPNEVAG